MRIVSADQLVSTGSQKGRRGVLAITEAGLQATDPYQNTCRLLRREGQFPHVGSPLFRAEHDPDAGEEIFDLNQVEHIYMVGAGRGVQRMVKALEEIIGDRLSGGEVIVKHGDELMLNRVHVTYGAHPVPDEGCIRGCERIVELAGKVTEKDVVLTVIGNGGSSLLTLPEDGITLEDVKQLIRTIQMEKGVITIELNAIRNHIDKLKGGKISMLFQKARQIHLAITDANHHAIQEPRHDYEGLLKGNVRLHNLSKGSTLADAARIMDKYNGWEGCLISIGAFIRRADPEKETIKYEQFQNTRFRVFGIMPDGEHFLPAARGEAEKLGYRIAALTQLLQMGTSQCAKVLSATVINTAEFGELFAPSLALFSSGEMLVTVDKADGVGGRNQESALAYALQIAGNEKIVTGFVDSDGTDGPGGLDIPPAPDCLGGGLVDGFTAGQTRGMGIDIYQALADHRTSEPLWRLNSGIHMGQNISLNDLTALLITE